MRKYIISGAAGAGKTTLIEALNEKNYPIVSEASRQIISQEQLNSSDGMPWGNIERYSRLVYQKIVDDLIELEEACFTDRSLIDVIAYLEYQDRAIPSSLKNFPFDKFYQKKAFVALPWEDIYENDAQRPESYNYHVQLSKKVIATYEKYNFEVIEIPFTSVDRRVDFVLENTCL
ncbi:AAA family ATPase [Flammeovirga pacifica]|uniref:NadR/Ttd14 AAA domain-containing protein n=1 Tax=Flammeovirga pacifica TaxID=915059 RepID=A0A1S1YXY9_FLAPC|nr:AAA family ATPase [Flammeovirga pacifica]OHX65871.1 hypothetical protein NH26_05650 [Flammeovirga pacifica]